MKDGKCRWNIEEISIHPVIMQVVSKLDIEYNVKLWWSCSSKIYGLVYKEISFWSACLTFIDFIRFVEFNMLWSIEGICHKKRVPSWHVFNLDHSECLHFQNTSVYNPSANLTKIGYKTSYLILIISLSTEYSFLFSQIWLIVKHLILNQKVLSKTVMFIHVNRILSSKEINQEYEA